MRLRAHRSVTLALVLCSVVGRAEANPWAREAPQAPEPKARPAARTEEIRFQNGEVSLAGRLYLPAGAGPFPAVVFAHGSGPVPKENPRFVEEASYLLEHGIAALLYDKRGVGGSSGDWKRATFEDLARDALAAVDALRRRSDIRAEAIGLRGASQAGYVLPIAATRSEHVAFVVLISPPVVSPHDQLLYNVEAELRAKDFSAADISEALSLARAGLEFARTRDGWGSYEALLRTAREKAWFAVAGGPDSRDDWMFDWYRPLLDFDCLPLLRRIHCPVLVLFGGESDAESPVATALPLLERALSAQGHSLSRIVSFPAADHGVRLTVADKRAFAPGFLETLRDFILQVVAPSHGVGGSGGGGQVLNRSSARFQDLTPGKPTVLRAE